jgi:hypothetical protein
MTHSGAWISYGGAARIWLAVVLLAAAAGSAYAGTRLRGPVGAAKPGRTALVVLILAWVLSLATFLVCLSVYVHQERQAHATHVVVAGNPIAPITLVAAGVTFVIVLISSPHRFGTTLVSATVAAMAAPMIFELPFDLVVMARTYPAIAPDPALYRALFFLPLFLIEITTLSFLLSSPMVKLSRATFFSFALMLLVFAVWGLAGFGYPSAPVPIALNVASKLIAFCTALCLFLPQRARPATTASAPAPAHSSPGPRLIT